MSVNSKKAVKQALEKGEYSLCEKADCASADCWSNYDRIRDGQGVIQPFVRCRQCLILLAYDSKKNGTSSLTYHAKNCRHSAPNANRSIAVMLARSAASSISSETKRSVTEALATLRVWHATVRNSERSRFREILPDNSGHRTSK